MDYKPPHVLIVDARFYSDISDELVRGATAVLDQQHATYERHSVPGVFEIPAAIKYAVCSVEAQNSQFDGYIALGCVIRGETTHYEYVCGESARALQDLTCQYVLAIGYGILTVDNSEQAWVRAGVDQRDKGGNAAKVCLSMVDLKYKFGLHSR